MVAMFLGWRSLLLFLVVVAIVIVIVIRSRPRKPATPAAPAAPPQQVPLYTMVTMPDGSQQTMPVANSMVAPGVGQDAPNGGFATLGFFFPVVGLILFLVWKDQTPLKARSAGKGALIGVIVDAVVVVVYIILMVVLVNSLNSSY